jgi:hypothetical protein
MMIRVGSRVGVPEKEIEQPVRATSSPRPSKVKTVIFMISPPEQIQ